MAQQNQGMQITVIILSILSLIAIIVAVVLWNGYSSQSIIAKEAQTKLDKLQSEFRSLETDAGKMKKMIGFADEKTPIADVEKSFQSDMQLHAPKTSTNAQEGTPVVVLDNYRVALGQTAKSLENEKDKNAGLNRENKLLQDRLDALNGEKKAIETSLQGQVSLAQTDLQSARAEFAKYMGEQEAKIKKLDEQLAKTELDAKAAIDVSKKNEATATQKFDSVLSINEGLKAKLIGLETPELTYFNTKVTFVAADNKTVWIDKGSADGLVPRISFSIYQPSANNVSRDKSKGSVEVTRILGPNTAEAKIVEGIITDPVMIGDLAFTPVWKPGQKQKFVLSSGLDIDGDQKSDVYLVRNIIMMNGGEVAAFVDDQSTAIEIVNGKVIQKVEIKGEVSSDATYYVTGEPLDNDSDELIAARTKMDADAKLNNLKEISLKDLLLRMGHTNLTTVEGFNYNRDTHKVDLAPGILDHASTGNVHESYTPGTKKVLPVSNGAGYSPLFRAPGTKASPTSNGATSDIFRPRTPKTGAASELQ